MNTQTEIFSLKCPLLKNTIPGNPERLVVHFYVRKDNNTFMAYLPRPNNPDRFEWDSHYRTEEDFHKTYADYDKKRIRDDL